MNIDEIVDRISGRWAASFKAWIFLTFLGSLGSITRTESILGITRRESLFLAFSAMAINGPIYYLFSATYLRKRFTEQLPIIRIFIFYLSIWLAAALTEILFTIYVFNKTAFLGPQLFAPLFPDIFGFIASSYLLAEFDSNRKDISRLEYARTTLLNTSEESKKQIIDEKSQIITAIQDSVFFQLDALRKQFISINRISSRQEIERIAEELESYSVNTIRTLSHEIGNEIVNTSPIDRLTFVGQKKIKQFSLVYAPYISLKLSIIVLLMVGGFNELSLNGFPGFFFQMLTTLAIAPILFFGSRATQKCGPTKLKLGFFFFLLTIFFSGYLTFLLSNILLITNFPLPNAYSSSEFAARTLVGIILSSLIVTIINARRRTLTELSELNNKLKIELDWMDNRSGELRKELATILHGPLQGRIAGVAMALRLMAIDTVMTDDERNKKLQDLENILTAVIKDVQELFKVDDSGVKSSIIVKLIELRRSWEGIAKVSWKVQPHVFAILPNSMFKAVGEILYEAVSNSVRHGGATEVKVLLDSGISELILTIEDDGTGIKGEFSPGAGLRRFSELGFKYEFSTKMDFGTKLELRTPLDFRNS